MVSEYACGARFVLYLISVQDFGMLIYMPAYTNCFTPISGVKVATIELVGNEFGQVYV